MIADDLAKEAQLFQSRVEFFILQDLPMKIREVLFLDRIGLPVFRATCK